MTRTWTRRFVGGGGGVGILVALLMAVGSPGLTLEGCVQGALDSNPDLIAAAKRVEAAAAAITKARSAYYPQVAVSGTYAMTDNAPQAFFMAMNRRSASLETDINNPGDTQNIRASVGARMRLLDAGQRSLQVDMAAMGRDAQAAAERAARNELVHAVTVAFYGTVQAREFVRVQEETVQSLQESLRVAGERVRAGSAVQTDVLNLDVRLAQAGEDLIRARNGFELAVAALNATIGKDVATLESVALVPVPTTVPPPETKAVGFLDRGELRASELQSRAREQAVRLATRDRLPTVSAFASVDWDADPWEEFERSYLGGVVLEWDVFTGFRKGAEGAEARALLAAARADEARVQRQLELDLTRARLGVRESWERVEVSGRGVKSAEEALRITRERYEQGAVDVTELLTAQVGRTVARTREVAARYDYLSARSNLERATGRRGGDLAIQGAGTGKGGQP